MNVPDGILCSKTNEWLEEEENCIKIGITNYAVEKLGEIVSIELPDIESYFDKNEVFAVIKSVKYASEIFMPVGGEIIEVNEKLFNSPELINEDAFENWLIKIKPANFQEDSQDLLDYVDYNEEI